MISCKQFPGTAVISKNAGKDSPIWRFRVTDRTGKVVYCSAFCFEHRLSGVIQGLDNWPTERGPTINEKKDGLSADDRRAVFASVEIKNRYNYVF
jgi:hypothetical protein